MRHEAYGETTVDLDAVRGVRRRNDGADMRKFVEVLIDGRWAEMMWSHSGAEADEYADALRLRWASRQTRREAGIE